MKKILVVDSPRRQRSRSILYGWRIPPSCPISRHLEDEIITLALSRILKGEEGGGNENVEISD